MNTFHVEPQGATEDRDLMVDWTNWLAGDMIAASIWSAPPESGITVHSTSVVSATKTIAWLTGGVPSAVPWKVTNQITDTSGRKADAVLLVPIV